MWKSLCIFRSVERQNYFTEQLVLQQFFLSILNHWNLYKGLPETQISWLSLLYFIVIFIVILIFKILKQIECGSKLCANFASQIANWGAMHKVQFGEQIVPHLNLFLLLLYSYVARFRRHKFYFMVKQLL